MRINYTQYQETEADIQAAYRHGYDAAKRGFARIAAYHVKYEKLWDAWLQGYDAYNEEKQS